MKKFLFVLMMLTLSIGVFAKGEFSGESGIGVGVINVNGDDKFALKLNFNPEFSISKLSIGAKLAVYLGDGMPVDVNGDGKENFDDVT